jgi:hypothetical protein
MFFAAQALEVIQRVIERVSVFVVDVETFGYVPVSSFPHISVKGSRGSLVFIVAPEVRPEMRVG